MQEWSVDIEIRAGDANWPPSGDAIDLFLDALGAAAPALSIGDDRYSARISTEAPDARGAAEVATDMVSAAAAKAGLPSSPIVRLSAETAETLEREISTSTMPS